MTNKMTIGITLLVVGFCFIIAGIVFIKNAKSNHIQVSENIAETKIAENIAQTTEPEISDREITSEKENTEQGSIAILENLISVATADGQLTNNEQKLLQAKAQELGLNYADYTAKIEELLQAKANDKETHIIDKNKEKGDNFEKYIVQKFSKKYFTIVEWAGDKYVNGIYAETTTQPDLKIKFQHNDISSDFAVECKYRTDYVREEINWCTQRQLQKYKKFADEKSLPVFIAIGVGGTATAPDELFIVPLKNIETNILSKGDLAKFKKANFKDSNFFFDSKTNALK